MGQKGGKNMSPTTLTKLAEKKKQLTTEKKRQMIRAGGSVNTKHIDGQEILRELRGK